MSIPTTGSYVAGPAPKGRIYIVEFGPDSDGDILLSSPEFGTLGWINWDMAVKNGWSN